MSPEELLSAYERTAKEAAHLREENEFLKGRIAWFERQIFGQKSERYIPNDQQTALDLGIPAEELEDTETKISYTRHTTGKKPVTPHGREELPAHLPRVKELVQPDFDTTGMEKVFDKVTEELHYKAPEFWVKQLICPVYAVVEGDTRRIVNTELPPRCNEKGSAGASMIAQTIVTKCVDHNPLYRFKDQIKRNCKLAIPSSTLDGWFSRGIFWLEPIARQLHRQALVSGYVQLDETTVRVMIEPTNGKSHQGYMVACLAPERNIVTFAYHNTRNREIIRDLLGVGYRGIVQTDGLDIYDFLSKRDDIVHVGCGAHARRGFDEALDNDRDRAQFVLDKYKQIFAVEARAAREAMTPAQRLALRRELSAPIMAELRTWLAAAVAQVTPRSLIGLAIAYMLNRWTELTAFLENGRIELSNNLIENRIRPLALGRKNWMFARTELSAGRLATAYSVLGTCRLLDINPFEYLTDVLERIPARSANDIDDLLPTNWKNSR
jgi:hypothetical protein